MATSDNRLYIAIVTNITITIWLYSYFFFLEIIFCLHTWMPVLTFYVSTSVWHIAVFFVQCIPLCTATMSYDLEISNPYIFLSVIIVFTTWSARNSHITDKYSVITNWK